MSHIRSMNVPARSAFAVSGLFCVFLALFAAGCATGNAREARMERYRPNTSQIWIGDDTGRAVVAMAERPVERRQEPVRATQPAPSPRADSAALKRGDRLMISLRGIPEPEDMRVVIDDRGEANLPFIGTIRIAGRTISEAAPMIERAYINGGYYTRINVIIVTQEDEYFVRGEVKSEGKFPISGDLTLMQAIASAGGYTDYARRNRIRVMRGDQVLQFNGVRIEQLRAPDPLIQPGDVIVVPRRFAW